jgi:predicted Fe-S protein YdhL (DUF1289 family)
MAMSPIKPIELEYGLDVESPCTGVCKYASPNDMVCVGCGRTEPEITDWIGLSSSEKQQIIDRIFK